MNCLDGKVALISGAARGIGGETARLMALAGARWSWATCWMIGVGRPWPPSMPPGARGIRAPGRDEGAGLDRRRQSRHQQVRQTRYSGEQRWRVHRQGYRGDYPGRMGQTGRGQHDGRIPRHELAAQALREAAKSSEHGSAIVNLASIAGIVGSQLDPLYSMTKGGVTLFTKSAALEFGRKGYRIRVNSIHPGVIQTDMGEQTFVARAQRTGSNDTTAVRQVVTESVPWGRMGVPPDIAKGIVFLASDDAGYMNGAGLIVDGGMTAV